MKRHGPTRKAMHDEQKTKELSQNKFSLSLLLDSTTLHFSTPVFSKVVLCRPLVDWLPTFWLRTNWWTGTLPSCPVIWSWINLLSTTLDVSSCWSHKPLPVSLLHFLKSQTKMFSFLTLFSLTFFYMCSLNSSSFLTSIPRNPSLLLSLPFALSHLLSGSTILPSSSLLSWSLPLLPLSYPEFSCLAFLLSWRCSQYIHLKCQ